MSALISETTRQTTLDFGGFKVSPDSIIDGPDLKLSELCDRSSCKSSALVRFVLLSTGAELIFCGNHARSVAPAMVKTGWSIDDQTYKAFQQRLKEDDDE